MSDITKSRIENAINRVLDLLAGDEITVIKKNGTEFTLNAIVYDYQWDGVEAEKYGLIEHTIKTVIISKAQLKLLGKTISKTDRFKYNGELFTHTRNRPISDDNVPLAGIQNVLILYLIRLEEKEISEEDTWGWE